MLEQISDTFLTVNNYLCHLQTVQFLFINFSYLCLFYISLFYVPTFFYLPTHQYFKRRKLLPNQVIEKELAGGDILVSTTVAHSDEVLPVIRYWIPHVRILEPLEMQQQLEVGLAAYLKRPVETQQ